MLKKLSLFFSGVFLSIFAFANDMSEIFELARKGDRDAQVVLYVNYYFGNEERGIEKDYPKAFYWLKLATEQSNDAGLQTLLADMYTQGQGVRQDFRKAFELFSQSAKQGNSASQYRLGNLYYDGQGTPQNYNLAFYWYKKSAEQNNPKGQIFLGGMYFEGKAVSENAQTAKYWFGRACDNGEQAGCDLYKMLNEQGY